MGKAREEWLKEISWWQRHADTLRAVDQRILAAADEAVALEEDVSISWSSESLVLNNVTNQAIVGLFRKLTDRPVVKSASEYNQTITYQVRIGTFDVYIHPPQTLCKGVEKVVHIEAHDQVQIVADPTCDPLYSAEKVEGSEDE